MRYRVEFQHRSGERVSASYPYLMEIASDMDYLAEHSPDVKVFSVGAVSETALSGSDAGWMESEAQKAWEYAAHRRGQI